jgi:glutamate racemase
MPAQLGAPIGVFDSGIGGLSILRALRALMPNEDYVYYADTAHAPYGEREDGFVMERAQALTRELVERLHIKALVVACNTATAAAIAQLRAQWPGLTIVGVEPALKPAAALSRTQRVGVLATRGTLSSEKFSLLKASLEGQGQGQADFVLQPCDGLAAAIEAGDSRRSDALLAQYIGALGPLGWQEGQIDTLVLGCTHYAFAMDAVQRLAGPQVGVLETGEPVARHTQRLLSNAGLLQSRTDTGAMHLRCSGSPAMLDALRTAAQRWIP